MLNEHLYAPTKEPVIFDNYFVRFNTLAQRHIEVHLPLHVDLPILQLRNVTCNLPQDVLTPASDYIMMATNIDFRVAVVRSSEWQIVNIYFDKMGDHYELHYSEYLWQDPITKNKVVTARVPKSLIGKRYVVVDTETTGLSTKNDCIVEIAAVEIVDGVIGKTFQQYIHAPKASVAEAINLHGLTEEFLKDFPMFDQVYDAFYEFAYGAKIVAHNAAYDVDMIYAEVSRFDKRAALYWDVVYRICTRNKAKKHFPEMSCKLNKVADRLGLVFDSTQYHGAMYDAIICANIFIALEKLEAL